MNNNKNMAIKYHNKCDCHLYAALMNLPDPGLSAMSLQVHRKQTQLQQLISDMRQFYINQNKPCLIQIICATNFNN